MGSAPKVARRQERLIFYFWLTPSGRDAYRLTTRSETALPMKYSLLILIALAAFVAGCAPSAQTPSGQAKSYPATILPSPERQEQAEREWRRLLELQSLPATPPDLDPITHTPRSLSSLPNGIKIT